MVYICSCKTNIMPFNLMSRFFNTFLLSACAIIVAAPACNKVDDLPGMPDSKNASRTKMDFDIMVTRDGQLIEQGRVMTKSDVETGTKLATMDTNLPFGLVGIDFEHSDIVLDNARISSSGGDYSAAFDEYMWSASNKISLSAYYPFVDELSYGDEYSSYAIPYSVNETEAGPLVSKTVEKAINQLNMVPLVFQHITNDIGYKICDITPDTNLQGLIHLRKVTATNVAQAGVFINDITSDTGVWHKQGYYRRIVVFEGDEVLGVGSANEKFIGHDKLVDRMADSHRYYSIPDDIEIGKQCVEVVYDVDSFTVGSYTYPPLKEQVAKFMLYGLLPDNVFVYGKQYTFHIGLDLSSVYHEITFAPAVGEWETHIYENNEDF